MVLPRNGCTHTARLQSKRVDSAQIPYFGSATVEFSSNFKSPAVDQIRLPPVCADIVAALFCKLCCEETIQRTQKPHLPRYAVLERDMRLLDVALSPFEQLSQELREDKKGWNKILCACSIRFHNSLD